MDDGKYRKRLLFDVDTLVAREILGEKKYRKIYKYIKRFMYSKGFNWIQGSGYESIDSISLLKISIILEELIEKNEYIEKCIRDIRVASIVDDKSLNGVFDYDGTPGKYKDMYKKQKTNNLILVDWIDNYKKHNVFLKRRLEAYVNTYYGGCA